MAVETSEFGEAQCSLSAVAMKEAEDCFLGDARCSFVRSETDPSVADANF